MVDTHVVTSPSQVSCEGTGPSLDKDFVLSTLDREARDHSTSLELPKSKTQPSGSFVFVPETLTL